MPSFVYRGFHSYYVAYMFLYKLCDWLDVNNLCRHLRWYRSVLVGVSNKGV